MEQNNGSTCTLSSVDDEPIVVDEDSSHSIALHGNLVVQNLVPNGRVIT